MNHCIDCGCSLDEGTWRCVSCKAKLPKKSGRKWTIETMQARLLELASECREGKAKLQECLL